MEKAIDELLQFVQIGARLDLKGVAVDHVLGLTGNTEGVEAVINKPKLLVSLICLLNDNTVPIAQDASLSLINISANEKGASKLLDLNLKESCPPLQNPPEDIVKQCLNQIFDSNSKIADQCCMILSNITRPIHLLEKTIDIFEDSGKTIEELINIFTKKEFNKKANLHYLGPLLSNLSQSGRVRKYILDKERCIIQRLLPFSGYRKSLIRRGGIIGNRYLKPSN